MRMRRAAGKIPRQPGTKRQRSRPSSESRAGNSHRSEQGLGRVVHAGDHNDAAVMVKEERAGLCGKSGFHIVGKSGAVDAAVIDKQSPNGPLRNIEPVGRLPDGIG